MAKSATDVMQEILFSAVIDSIAAMKVASKGLPNTLLRDLNALHDNVTFADLSPELQAAITTNVRSAFTRLQKEGYSVSSGAPVQPRTPPLPPRRDTTGHGGRDRRPPPPPKRDGGTEGKGGPRPSGGPGGGNARPPRGPRPKS